ncbi:MAG: type II restriction endonuclease [Chordicoccus sp.]|jgi:hypothetical protein
MNDDVLSLSAINDAIKGKEVFCKFMSANDSGESGAHQVGFLISIKAKSMLFTDEEMRANPILKKPAKVSWQNGEIITDSVFTWYSSKKELRLTRFGRDFPFINPEYTGALFVLIKNTPEDYSAYILNTEDDIQQFLDAFGLTPAETNRLISFDKITPEMREKAEIEDFISNLSTEFPTSEEMSREARLLTYVVNIRNQQLIKTDPDRLLLKWTDEEYTLFRAIERARYGEIVAKGFSSVDEFVMMANKVLNRRKSRAGKSLEHHLAAIFDGNNIQYTAQAITEGNKRPDFLFPSEEAYHDMTFSIEKLCSLAAKTTCKDRWRQVLNEADRFKDRTKYLCTMQQGISAAQMDEMQAEQVVLVVPKEYIKTYPADRRSRIWTISKFVSYVMEMENL